MTDASPWPPLVAQNHPLGLWQGPGDGDWPLYGLCDDVRDGIATLLRLGLPGALATLVRAAGPSPRPIGSQMLVDLQGRAAGYVSGGCIEGNLALIGQEVVAVGTPRLLVFGAGSPYADIALLCGSRIEVLVERVDPLDRSWADMLRARDARQSVVRRLLFSGAAVCEPAPVGGDWVLEADEKHLSRRYDPVARLIVFGRDPVAIALASLARASGFETILSRRLGPETVPDGLCDHYERGSPSRTLEAFGLDAWTAVVTTTHDLDEDHEALAAALVSPAFFVGALGSRRRLADRVHRLEAAGVGWEAVKRLSAPVGLDIGAASPGEIAISILADVVRARRAGGA